MSQVAAAIYIITRKAGETQGGLMTGGGGTQERAFGTARYGWKIGGDFNYRVFTKYLDRNDAPDLASAANSFDHWHLLHSGFRVDGSLSPVDFLTVQGDIYTGNEGAELVHATVDPPGNVNVVRRAGLAGGNVMGR